jgi:signal transduction histidine kinase
MLVMLRLIARRWFTRARRDSLSRDIPGTTPARREKALQWNQQQERLIDGLLTLASSERGIEHWEPFDLAAKAILDRHHDADRRGIRIDAALSAAPATGDPALAESLVANLLGNAIRHNVDGGRIDISTAITDGRAVLTVSNTGPLIPPDEIDGLFQPFQRLGTQRIRASGPGLGLAIVSAIVSVHGAALTANARAEGGLDITVSFATHEPAKGAAQLRWKTGTAWSTDAARPQGRCRSHITAWVKTTPRGY